MGNIGNIMANIAIHQAKCVMWLIVKTFTTNLR